MPEWLPPMQSDPMPEGTDPPKSPLWTVLRIVGALTLVGLALRHASQMDHSELPWRTISLPWLLLCFGLTAVSILGLWVRWLIFLRLTGVPATPVEAFRLTWIADFFNYFFLGPLAADSYRIVMLARKHPGKLPAIAASVVLDHLAGMVGLGFFFGGVTVPNAKWIIERGGPMASACLWAAGIALGIILLVSLSGVAAAQTQQAFLARILKRWPSFASKALEMLDRLRQVRVAWKLSLLGVLAAVLCLLANYAAFGAAARAWHAALPWSSFFALLPVVDAYSSLPISVQGLGIREQFFLGVLVADGGATHSQVLAVSLTGFVVQAAWALMGGVLLIFSPAPFLAKPKSICSPADKDGPRPAVTPGLAVSLSSSFYGFYCHVGFMAELHRQGYYPEQIAGASSGALTALMCGSGLRGEKLEAFIRQPGVRRSIYDWGWWWRLPGVVSHIFGTGVLNGNNMVRFLKEKLGPLRLEDLKEPKIQIAVTNLTHKRLDIITRGDAAEYAVSSSLVPGLFQARRLDGSLWCDGGTVDVVPFEHWLDQPDVETIVLHEILHEPGSVPQAPGGGTNIAVAMALCHEIMSNQMLSYRLRLAALTDKRVIHIQTYAPHPGIFPRKSREVLRQRGREAAVRLCDQLRSP